MRFLSFAFVVLLAPGCGGDKPSASDSRLPDAAQRDQSSTDSAMDALTDDALRSDVAVDVPNADSLSDMHAIDTIVDALASDATVDSLAPDTRVDAAPPPSKLLWPIDCVPGVSCYANIGYPDTDGDGKAFDCSAPGYTSHEGTDIGMTWQQMDQGVDVFAAAAGTVRWVFDGKYDRCPDANEPDCQPPSGSISAGMSEGTTVCTPLGNFCSAGSCCCYWCFAGGNVVVIEHTGIPGVFATRYDHLKMSSIVVSPGDTVLAGQKIAQVGSAGASSGPHLHFEVWGAGYYDPVDPWAGSCGPNHDTPLWAHDPPWDVP